MGTSTFQRSFAGGELSPSLAARADTAKYLAGLRTCHNFIVLRHGGVANRAGLRYIRATKDSATDTFLLKYLAAEVADSVLIEAGPFYLRFYQAGALVTLTGVLPVDGSMRGVGSINSAAGVNYYAIQDVDSTLHPPPDPVYWYPMPGDILEVPTPFGTTGFRWVQSGNVITLTSPVVPPHELINGGFLDSWIIRPVNFFPEIGPPTALVITPGPAGTLSYQYIVTACDSVTGEESTGSAIAQVTNVDVPTPLVPHVIAWTAPIPSYGFGLADPLTADSYNVYKDPYGNGTFGYIGTANGQESFNDIGFIPDYAVTPPIQRILLGSDGEPFDFPLTAGHHQQRRFFAHTRNVPDGIWGSRTGRISNFNISNPLQEDDALTFRIAGNEHNPVQHLVGLKTLVVLTDTGEWTVGGGSNPTVGVLPLSPNSIAADQQGYVGAAAVRPVVVGNAILYVQACGTIVRDLQFAGQVDGGMGGKDLTIYAAHLFDGYTIDRMDYQQTPQSIIWCVRSDGTLLGLTYIPEQEVWGWHRHTTGAGGIIEDVCVVPEPGEDTCYVLVRRTIGGVFKRSIERLERRTILNFAADSFFVDAGLTYTGPPKVTTIAGLEHLEGEIVAVVCDGVVVFDGDPTDPRAASFTVTGGTIAAVLPSSTIVHAGLPIRFGDIELLDLDVAGSNVRDKKKRIGSVSLLIDTSARTFRVGPDPAHLTKHKLKPFESGPGLPFTGQEEIQVATDYNVYGRVYIRQTDPLPLTILGVLPNVELGG